MLFTTFLSSQAKTKRGCCVLCVLSCGFSLGVMVMLELVLASPGKKRNCLLAGIP